MAKAKKEKAPSASSVDPGKLYLFDGLILNFFNLGESAVLNYLKTQNRPYSAGTIDNLFGVLF